MENRFDEKRCNAKTLAALVGEMSVSQDAVSATGTGVDRIFVKPIGENGVERESLAVALTDPGKTVGGLKHELVKRLQLSSEYTSVDEYELRMSSNGVLLQDADLVGALLRSDEFITLCKKELCSVFHFTVFVHYNRSSRTVSFRYY